MTIQEPNHGNEYDYSSEIQLPIDRFELWFQPIYQLRVGKVLHNEVLVRWRDDSGNLRMAKEFLPLLQNSGLIGKLDRLVIDKVLEVMSQTSDVIFSVNLSGDSISNRNIVHRIQLGLKQAGVLPHRLGFEFSEETIASDFETVAAFMADIKHIGCYTVIDSFTGKYLTLSQLHSLPANAVKLDREIIGNLRKDPSCRTFVRAIVQINAIWSRHCIAKSVGDNSTLKVVRDIGIECAQGYGLKSPESKPDSLGSVAIFVGFIGRVLSVLVALYVLKSALGINIFPDKHVWEVAISFLESLFK